MKKVAYILLLSSLLLLTGCFGFLQNSSNNTDENQVSDLLNPLNPEQSQNTEQQNNIPNQNQTQTPPNNETPAEPQEPVSPPKVEAGLVDSVEVVILESQPPIYLAVIKGNYRNGCERLDSITQNLQGDKVVMELKVKSDGGICTQALTPFVQNVEIDSLKLTPATNYTVEVNGLNTSFKTQ